MRSKPCLLMGFMLLLLLFHGLWQRSGSSGGGDNQLHQPSVAQGAKVTETPWLLAPAMDLLRAPAAFRAKNVLQEAVRRHWRRRQQLRLPLPVPAAVLQWLVHRRHGKPTAVRQLRQPVPAWPPLPVGPVTMPRLCRRFVARTHRTTLKHRRP
ncbi:hypothetical protein MUK42_32943 [Musa troglodytarum]|uniref:Secreted protein n=1 Tax=Musa troglodytarum TaxID=320322 RepID=A0A9E7LAW9_9LILI|nr:hypothetical protein MUK42_32943 [Musa troglodytarum]